MNGQCDRCGYISASVRASLRRYLFTCEGCEKTFCTECLFEMKLEQGLVPPSNERGYLKFRLLWLCAESQMALCPICFEDPKG